MAMPLGFFSTLPAAVKPSLAKPPSSTLMLVHPAAFKPSDARLRTLVTYATASKPVTETQPKKRTPRGFEKPRPVSPEMKDFIGGRKEISRTEVLKVIWAYIKEKDLQDPANKRVIRCDEKLKKIFGERENVGFLEIAGLISPHFLKVEA